MVNSIIVLLVVIICFLYLRKKEIKNDLAYYKKRILETEPRLIYLENEFGESLCRTSDLIHYFGGDIKDGYTKVLLQDGQLICKEDGEFLQIIGQIMRVMSTNTLFGKTYVHSMKDDPRFLPDIKEFVDQNDLNQFSFNDLCLIASKMLDGFHAPDAINHIREIRNK